MTASNLQRLEERLSSVLRLVEEATELTMEDLTLTEDALKQMFILKRKRLTEIKTSKKRDSLSCSPQPVYLAGYHKGLKKDLFNFCMSVVDLFDSKIVPKTRLSQEKVFAMKVKGDFYRYSVECLRKGDKFYEYIFQEGLKAYATAYELAVRELSCENLVGLNLCLNFSVFYYTVAEDSKKACEIISSTLSKLEAEMNSILPEILKSIQPTVCLLKNNLILWLHEIENDHHSN